MKRFIKEIVFLGLPLVLWAFFVVLIDPFNYFDISSLISNKLKEVNAFEVNPLLYTVIDLHHNPTENILIGDSRTEALPLDEIEKYSGKEYKKLIIYSAKLNEIFDLIYLANKEKKLKHVVIGINFSLFNEFAYNDRVKNVQDIIGNPLKYIYNKNVAQVCYYLIKAVFTGKGIDSKPDMTKEEFWKYIIETRAYQWYGKYKFSEKLENDLLALDNFAKENNIKLTFIIIPHNKEFHNRLVEFGLSEEENKFKTIMKNLNAEVVDYDYDNAITENKNYFLDPVHYNDEVGHILVNEIWNDKYTIGKKLK
jgi:hypothetical protein